MHLSESKRERLAAWPPGLAPPRVRSTALLSAGGGRRAAGERSAVAITLGAVSVPAGTVWQILLSRLPFVGDLVGQGATWSAAQEAVVLQIRSAARAPRRP